ncbi:MAG: hypothetical protein QXO32_02140 [Candidatus Bathyarchaeia archaeon]
MRSPSSRFKRAWKGLRYVFRVRGGIPSRYVDTMLKIFFGLVLVFSAFMAAGGIYNLMEEPLALLPRGGGWTFIYRGNIHIQTLNESIVAGIVYVLGISGLYMMFRSTKYAYRPRQAYILLLIGAVITLLSFYYTNVMLQSKIGAG